MGFFLFIKKTPETPVPSSSKKNLRKIIKPLYLNRNSLKNLTFYPLFPMMKRLAKLFLWCVRFRYDIQIKGLSQLKSAQSYLVLPNHSSLLEPMIIFSLFVPKVRLRPVATSAFANNRFLKRFFDRIGAIAVEESSSKDSQLLASRLNHSLDQLQSALEVGDSVLLFPSGQIAGQGKEYL